MLPSSATAHHRASLRSRISDPILVMAGRPQLRNIPINHLPYRADSTFLWLTGCTSPGAAILLNDDGATLFVTVPPDDDALWHGPQPSIAEQAAQLGLSRVRPLRELGTAIRPHGDSLRTLASTDPHTNQWLRTHTGRPHHPLSHQGDPELIAAIIDLRSQLDEWEIEETRAIAQVTEAAHRAAMATTKVGSHEAKVGAVFDGVIAAHGLTTAYDSIVTVRGEVLHNFHRCHTLEDGQLLLLDGGAEGNSGYATDVTRTWPVNGRFNPRQKAAYQAVLDAQAISISMCRPGTRYRDIHLASAKVLTRFLVDEGLLRGQVDTLVERGAHALFFPHGVGHLIGLDVHDLELYGDLAGYGPGRTRSTQFGLNALRLDRDLAAGNVVTIEPGFYVVPAILSDTHITGPFADVLNRTVVERWLGFGGIRIEDNVHVTPTGPELLTSGIPKTVSEVEKAVSAELMPFW